MAPETLCSYGPPLVLPIPWGEWDGWEQIMVNGGAPHSVSHFTDLLMEGPPPNWSGPLWFHGHSPGDAVVCCPPYTPAWGFTESGLWYLEFESTVYIMQLWISLIPPPPPCIPGRVSASVWGSVNISLAKWFDAVVTMLVNTVPFDQIYLFFPGQAIDMQTSSIKP